MPEWKGGRRRAQERKSGRVGKGVRCRKSERTLPKGCVPLPTLDDGDSAVGMDGWDPLTPSHDEFLPTLDYLHTTALYPTIINDDVKICRGKVLLINVNVNNARPSMTLVNIYRA